MYKTIYIYIYIKLYMKLYIYMCAISIGYDSLGHSMAISGTDRLEVPIICKAYKTYVREYPSKIWNKRIQYSTCIFRILTFPLIQGDGSFQGQDIYAWPYVQHVLIRTYQCVNGRFSSNECGM